MGQLLMGQGRGWDCKARGPSRHILCVVGHHSCPLYLPPKVFHLPPQYGYGSHLSRLSCFWLDVTSHSTSFRWKDFLLPLSPSLVKLLPSGVVALSPKHRFPGPSSPLSENGTIAFLPLERNLFNSQDCISF